MMKQLKKGQLIFDKEAKINIISHLDGKSKNEVGIEVHSLSPAALVKLFEAYAMGLPSCHKEHPSPFCDASHSKTKGFFGSK